MSPAPTSRATAAREELRVRRQAAILELALEVVSDEGHDGLTMQRIADELECGIASVYRLFPSRDALVAALLQRALDVLHASWRLGLDEVGAEAARRELPPGEAALAKAVGAAWFWVVAGDVHPAQIDLARRLFIDPRIVVPAEQGAEIVPAGLRLLQEGGQIIDDAVDAGALGAGNGIERAVVVVASLTGVVLTAKFRGWDAALFDARRLAEVALRGSFTAWGAEAAALDTATALALELGRDGRLAPAVALLPR